MVEHSTLEEISETIAIVEYLSRDEMSVGRLCEMIGVEQANAPHILPTRGTSTSSKPAKRETTASLGSAKKVEQKTKG
ncbi:MAG TPA: hypothetical protein VGL71_03295 [Urbifossiella sp.]|jgi:hypothetical protein